jgi:hypothetical protein
MTAPGTTVKPNNTPSSARDVCCAGSPDVLGTKPNTRNVTPKMPGPRARPKVSPAGHSLVNAPAWRLPTDRVVRDAIGQHGQAEELLARISGPDQRDDPVHERDRKKRRCHQRKGAHGKHQRRRDLPPQLADSRTPAVPHGHHQDRRSDHAREEHLVHLLTPERFSQPIDRAAAESDRLAHPPLFVVIAVDHRWVLALDPTHARAQVGGAPAN